MLRLHRKEIALLFALLAGGGRLCAQMNNPGYDNKVLHFGITLGFNASGFKVYRYESDTVYVVEPSRGPGFNLGIISDLKIGKHLNMRFIPNLSFAEKRLNYTLF